MISVQVIKGKQMVKQELCVYTYGVCVAVVYSQSPLPSFVTR